MTPWDENGLNIYDTVYIINQWVSLSAETGVLSSMFSPCLYGFPPGALVSPTI